MSVSRSDYILIGYDFTHIKDLILTEEFMETDEYDDLVCNQIKGEIQFFDDPMSGDYLYFGYIVSCHDDEWNSYCDKLNFDDYELVKDWVNKKFESLSICTGDIKEYYLEEVKCEILGFAEFR